LNLNLNFEFLFLFFFFFQFVGSGFDVQLKEKGVTLNVPLPDFIESKLEDIVEKQWFHYTHFSIAQSKVCSSDFFQKIKYDQILIIVFSFFFFQQDI